METTTGHVRINLQSIEKELARYGTKLLPVTKTFGIELIQEAYSQGYRAFGENKVQELLPKYEALPKDIDWHLIGHLQSNKVKYIAPFIGMIESVDSEKLLAEIDRQAGKNNRKIKCLLQVYIATEESKFGWSPEELIEWIARNNLPQYQNVKIEGLMGMASFSENENLVRSEFQTLKKLYNELKNHQTDNLEMKTLSMGMSGDYQIACEEGSTSVRMGTRIFGRR